MKTVLSIPLLILALATIPAGPALADEIVSETRSVDARVMKIRVDGQITVKLKQGATPSLTVYAEKRWLPKIITVQNGDSLRIDTDVSGLHFNSPQLRAELTLPALRELTANGVGAVDMSGFGGDELRLVQDGVGNVSVASRYKNIHARLGGVGNLNFDCGDSESLELVQSGVGRMTFTGRAKTLNAKLSGVGSLDAQQLQAQAVTVDADGVGSAKVFAQQSVNVNLSGVGSVSVFGRPANRHVKSDGIGSVKWE